MLCGENQTFVSYLPYKPSYSQFCVKIFTFSLPWQFLLAQISLAQLNSPTPITHTRCTNGGRVSHTSRVIANFLSNFSNFRCLCNGGWSGTNFSRTVKFADPDNNLLGAGMGVVSPIQSELLPILC